LFHEWLREVRKGRLSQGDLAAAARTHDPGCHVQQPHLSGWEHGKGLPSLRQFFALVGALGLPAAEVAKGRALLDEAELARVAAEVARG